MRVATDTLGAALRERRWALGLAQRDAADRIGVPVATYRAWETNRARPTLRHLPEAIAFLDYDWRTPPATFGACLRHRRTTRGLSIARVAQELGIDGSTLQKWECDLHTPTRKLRLRVQEWMNS